MVLAVREHRDDERRDGAARRAVRGQHDAEYAEQSCNHFIAFKLLALIRDKVFRALRRLCPAKREGRDHGDLISVITSDIELLEVFYAHTISPAVIAALFTLIMCLFIGHYHALLGLWALAAYVCVGVVIPLITSRRSGDTGMRFRTESGALSAFVLDSLRGLNETIQYDCGAARRAEMDERLERSISTGVTSKPASFIVLAIACAFSNYLSPTTIFIPAPMRRAMAMPICPAPAHNMTSFIVFLLTAAP